MLTYINFLLYLSLILSGAVSLVFLKRLLYLRLLIRVIIVATIVLRNFSIVLSRILIYLTTLITIL